MSPGDRSLDAIGLVNQINEESAGAYADARKVLGSETPESILRQRCLKNQNSEGDINYFSNSQLDGRQQSVSVSLLNPLSETQLYIYSLSDYYAIHDSII